jgi:hypothetical protein
MLVGLQTARFRSIYVVTRAATLLSHCRNYFLLLTMHAVHSTLQRLYTASNLSAFHIRYRENPSNGSTLLSVRLTDVHKRQHGRLLWLVLFTKGIMLKFDVYIISFGIPYIIRLLT